ncbi:hypothetical protein ACKVWC_010079 [Pyricularia oryzae]
MLAVFYSALGGEEGSALEGARRRPFRPRDARPPCLHSIDGVAALNVRGRGSKVRAVGSAVVEVLSGAKFEAYVGILKETPLFSAMPEWKLRASLLESSLFTPLLRDELKTAEAAHRRRFREASCGKDQRQRRFNHPREARGFDGKLCGACPQPQSCGCPKATVGEIL